MTASRLTLQSAIVLSACVVGFVMGRSGAPSATFEPGGETHAGSLPLEPGWDLDISSTPGASVPALRRPGVDSTSGLGRDSDRGPNRQFYPEALQRGGGPGPFSGPSSAEPIQRVAPAATAAQIQALILQELPGVSESDQRVWGEELEGMTLETAREVLMLRQALDALEDTGERDAADPDSR